MASNQQLRARIRTAGSISKITKAMEAVAASKMRRAQETAMRGKAYEQLMRRMAQSIIRSVNPRLHPLLAGFSQASTLPTLTVLITPDRGLAGPLNANVFRLAEQSITAQSPVIAIGKKSVSYARKTDWNVIAAIESLGDQPSFSDTTAASTVALEEFTNRRAGKLQLLYPQFVSTLVQQAVVEQVLPLSADEFQSEGEILQPKYIFEPSGRVILDELLPAYIRLSIYQAVLSMKAAEQSARMIAMKNASENAAEVRQYLQLLYNQNRQKAITSEIADIVTATMALS